TTIRTASQVARPHAAVAQLHAEACKNTLRHSQAPVNVHTRVSRANFHAHAAVRARSKHNRARHAAAREELLKSMKPRPTTPALKPSAKQRMGSGIGIPTTTAKDLHQTGNSAAAAATTTDPESAEGAEKPAETTAPTKPSLAIFTPMKDAPGWHVDAAGNIAFTGNRYDEDGNLASDGEFDERGDLIRDGPPGVGRAHTQQNELNTNKFIKDKAPSTDEASIESGNAEVAEEEKPRTGSRGQFSNQEEVLEGKMQYKGFLYNSEGQLDGDGGYDSDGVLVADKFRAEESRLRKEMGVPLITREEELAREEEWMRDNDMFEPADSQTDGEFSDDEPINDADEEMEAPEPTGEPPEDPPLLYSRNRPVVYRSERFWDDDFPEEMVWHPSERVMKTVYAFYCQDPKVWTISRLATHFAMAQDTVMGLIQLMEMREVSLKEGVDPEKIWAEDQVHTMMALVPGGRNAPPLKINDNEIYDYKSDGELDNEEEPEYKVVYRKTRIPGEQVLRQMATMIGCNDNYIGDVGPPEPIVVWKTDLWGGSAQGATADDGTVDGETADNLEEPAEPAAEDGAEDAEEKPVKRPFFREKDTFEYNFVFTDVKDKTSSSTRKVTHKIRHKSGTMVKPNPEMAYRLDKKSSNKTNRSKRLF
ncbi:hypothetical protein SARC_10719, partial [Sphaeroforma arctica JP610]